MFEYREIIECIKFAESFLSNNTDVQCFARKFPIMIRRIKDDDFLEFTFNIRSACKDFINLKIAREELIEHVKTFIEETKDTYQFLF